MKLTEVHSTRIDLAIREALRKATTRHSCASGAIPPGAYDDDDHDGSVAFQEIHVPSVARAILAELQKLEAELTKEAA